MLLRATSLSDLPYQNINLSSTQAEEGLKSQNLPQMATRREEFSLKLKCSTDATQLLG